MNQKTIYQELQTLPPEAQQQVADFIAFLQTRYAPVKIKVKKKNSPGQSLTEEAFVGMWRERADMHDSRQWVREARCREWGS